MGNRRNYELEVVGLVRERLIADRKNPLGLDPMYDFQAEDVRLEAGLEGNEVVVLFRVRGKDGLLGYQDRVVRYPGVTPRDCLEISSGASRGLLYRLYLGARLSGDLMGLAA